MRNAYKILGTKLGGRGLGVNGRITLNWVVEMQGVKVWTVFNWLRIGSQGRVL
jgi:hypothetical protein